MNIHTEIVVHAAAGGLFPGDLSECWTWNRPCHKLDTHVAFQLCQSALSAGLELICRNSGAS